MDSVDNMDIDALFTSKTEKTFQYQDELPSLPVPSLQHTLDRYLDSVKPHVMDEEYRQTEFIAQQFASGIGKELHKKLLERAANSRNWKLLSECQTDWILMRRRVTRRLVWIQTVCKGLSNSADPDQKLLQRHSSWSGSALFAKLESWWNDYAYMDFRPTLASLNFGGPGPYRKNLLPLVEGSQIPRAGLLIFYHMKTWHMMRQERLKPDKDSKGAKLCMDQYHNAFSTCRIPAVKRDHLNYYFKTEAEGPSPQHLIVMCRGRVFTMQAVDDNEEPLTPPELQAQFQHIRDKCDREPEGPGIGALTGDNRTSWAQMRNRLIALHPQNNENLVEIQKSILLVVLDDSSPQDENEVFKNGLAGDSSNRWFDKSLTLIFYKNGLVASNCDHSPYDAMVLVSCTFFIDLNVRKTKGKWQGSQEVRKFDMPRELVFVLDDVIYKGIDNAKRVYNAFANNLQLCTKEFTDYGKNYLRKYKLHPDTHVQLALQYAYYKTYKKPAPTYETAMTRKYYRARTETMRSCTTEALDWSKAMCDPNATMQQKYHLFMRAMNRHNKLMAEAQNSEGCDRHLLGLQIIAIESGLPMPQLYTDPSFTKSGGGGNYVLSTSFVGYTTVYGGVVPMVENGYGSFYKIEQDKITIFVSSWASCAETDATKFRNTIQDCLRDMGTVVESGMGNSARL